MAITIDVQEIANRNGLQVEEVERIIARARNSVNPSSKSLVVTENGESRQLNIMRLGVGPITTDHGKLWEYNFKVDDQWSEYLAVWRGEVDDNLNPVLANRSNLLMRTDSGCETGQVMGDRTCECREQLHIAMEEIVKHGEGLIIHIPRQDGRGMGVDFKLSTLYLQDTLGLNTVESATVMARGSEFDIRTYGGVIAVMGYFGITTQTVIDLATNNPHKAQVFIENGYVIRGLKAIKAPVTDHTRRHLEAKQSHLGHLCLVGEG